MFIGDKLAVSIESTVNDSVKVSMVFGSGIHCSPTIAILHFDGEQYDVRSSIKGGVFYTNLSQAIEVGNRAYTISQTTKPL